MQKKGTKRAGLVLLALLGLGIAGWLGWPRPLPIDVTTIAKMPMEVTVDEDGKTEVRHVYTLSAPVAGRVLRISHPEDGSGIARHVGDLVKADDPVVVMQPMSPSFIDTRSREQISAEIAAADAAIKQAEADVHRFEAALTLAQADYARSKELLAKQMTSAQAFDMAASLVNSNTAALASAKAQVDVRRSARASLAAQLKEPASGQHSANAACCLLIRAPLTSHILRILQESEAVVPVGTPLVQLGDLHDLDITTDLLSSDAVQIVPGAAVRIDGWGGPVLNGRVTRVDPAGFIKVSALGIEEQRVHVIIDLVDPREVWSRLGHNFGVTVHVTVWQSAKTLTVPVSAMFRNGDKWAVYTVRDGHAHTTTIQTGHRNNRMAEVLSGLAAGDRVIAHPSDRIRDGAAVAEQN